MFFQKVFDYVRLASVLAHGRMHTASQVIVCWITAITARLAERAHHEFVEMKWEKKLLQRYQHGHSCGPEGLLLVQACQASDKEVSSMM